MLPPATLHLIDRLVTAVMTIVRAVAPTDAPSSTPTLPAAAAETLFFRLSHLVINLIRIRSFGVHTPTKSQPEPDSPNPPIPASPSPAQRGARGHLPCRPGWLLTALPEIATPVAADIRVLLDDPAIAALFDQVPSLGRSLRPLLRALGLDAPLPIPTPPRPPSSPPTYNPPRRPTPPSPSKPPRPTAASKLAQPNTRTPHANFIA